MPKFKCKKVPGKCVRCGGCCRFGSAKSLTEEEEEKILTALFRSTGFIYPYGLFSPGLDIQSYEYSRFQRIASENGVKLELRPKKALYDTKRQLTIVFDWLLPCTECPFLRKKTECLIYDERFEICRLFPSTGQKLPEVEKRHAVVAELIKSGEIVMPSADNYQELVKLALASELINFDDFVEIKEI